MENQQDTHAEEKLISNLISGGDCSKSNRRDEEKYLVQKEKEKEKSLTVQRKANEIGGRDYFLSIILFLVKDDGAQLTSL